MYSLITRSEHRFSTLWLSSAEHALYVAVESDGRATYLPSKISRLITESVGSCELFAQGSTAVIARAIDEKLKNAERTVEMPAWLFFCAVLMRPGEVEACEVGSFRVHVIQDEEPIVAIGGELARPALPPGFEDLAPLMSSIETRSLGTCDRPPEAISWATKSSRRVVVCSADYHRRRAPMEYLPSIMSETTGDGSSDFLGSAAIIEVVSDAPGQAFHDDRAPPT